MTSGDANVFPQVMVNAELGGESERGSGVHDIDLTITVLSKFADGYAFIPTGFSTASCSSNAMAGQSGTIENGHKAHSLLTGNMLNHFLQNQAAWREGIEATGRGIKVLDLLWQSETQDENDGVMTTELGFTATAWWDGTGAKATEVPKGQSDKLTGVVTFAENPKGLEYTTFALVAAVDSFDDNTSNFPTDAVGNYVDDLTTGLGIYSHGDVVYEQTVSNVVPSTAYTTGDDFYLQLVIPQPPSDGSQVAGVQTHFWDGALVIWHVASNGTATKVSASGFDSSGDSTGDVSSIRYSDDQVHFTEHPNINSGTAFTWGPSIILSIQQVDSGDNKLWQEGDRLALQYWEDGQAEPTTPTFASS